MSEQRDNRDFVSRAPARRHPPHRKPPAGSTQKRNGVSSMLSICAVMLCCMLVLSIAFFEEPYVPTAAGSYRKEEKTLGEEILGRLVYLCEEFASVFSTQTSLVLPVSGQVTATVSDTGGYTAFSAAAGSPVYAVAKGRVSNVYSDDSGVIVEVNHEDGSASRYCALSEAVVDQYQPVDSGDVLGVTLSGRLLFFCESSGSYCDPLPLIGSGR